MFEVDARGLSCPEPVLLTAQALKEHQTEAVKVLVDEVHTRANVEKFAKSQGKAFETVSHASEYEIIIQP